jgi:hypothetical protein
MKFSLECKADTNILIGEEITVVDGEKTFILIPDEKGILSGIKIIANVREPEKFYSIFKNGDKWCQI